MSELEKQIQTLEKDIEKIDYVFDKLDNAVDKLTTCSSLMNRMIELHEQKLKQHDDLHRELFDLIESRRKEAQAQSEDLNKKVYHIRDEIMSEIKDMRQKDEIDHQEMSARLAGLERWRWYVLGAVSTVAVLYRFISFEGLL